MKLCFYRHSAILFSLAFFLFTILGTLTHEIGHFVVAQFYGFPAKLHYGSISYSFSPNDKTNSQIFKQINSTPSVHQKKKITYNPNELKKSTIWITIGGPMQTCITGIIGLIILYYRKSKNNIFQNKSIDWIGVFLSLFWLREVFNLVLSCISELINPTGHFFHGDEYKISTDFNLWEGTVPLLLGILGFIIVFKVIFQIIPFRLRFTFIISGLLGAIPGYIVWMYILGPLILP